MHRCNVLFNLEVISILLFKPTGGLRDKWWRKVLEIRSKVRRDPEWADLIDFVSDENLTVHDPFFFKESCWAVYLKEISKSWKEIVNICSKLYRMGLYLKIRSEIGLIVVTVTNCIAALHLWKIIWKSRSAFWQRNKFSMLACNQWNKDRMPKHVIKG